MRAALLLAAGLSAAGTAVLAHETVPPAPHWPQVPLPPTTLKLDYAIELGAQLRAFPDDGAYAGQGGSGLSLSIEPEIDFELRRGQLRLTAFARWDQRDGERSHADLRELLYQVRFGNFDLQAGVGRVFWGVTESVHLVDIINQTDAVENPDGEDKLGQPLLNLAWTTGNGVWSAYVLPGFRERTLPGERGRFRGPIPYWRGDARYESGAEERHVDLALRWSLSRGPFDLGVSHFSGTAREPTFALRIVPALQPAPVPLPVPGPVPGGGGLVGITPGLPGLSLALVPVYDQIEQTAVDLNLVHGGWLWKLEALHQHSRNEDYQAAAGGFEYTFSGLFGLGWDVGALAELLWDSRGDNAPSPFQKDLFVGSRLAANDIAGTELLAGVIADLERSGWFGSLEASRRIGGSARLAVELRWFGDADPRDPMSAFDRDDYLQLEYIHYL